MGAGVGCNDSEYYMRWGLQMLPPDNPLFLDYGDDTMYPSGTGSQVVVGGHRFAHPPRQWSVGVRVTF